MIFERENTEEFDYYEADADDFSAGDFVRVPSGDLFIVIEDTKGNSHFASLVTGELASALPKVWGVTVSKIVWDSQE